MFVSVLVRRLREGRSYEDFVRAWYPDKGFGFPGRGPMLAVNIEDEREILAIGFVDLPSREAVMEALQRVAEQESVRHERIAEVIESTVVRGIYEVKDEFDFSSDEAVTRGRPAFLMCSQGSNLISSSAGSIALRETSDLVSTAIDENSDLPYRLRTQRG